MADPYPIRPVTADPITAEEYTSRPAADNRAMAVTKITVSTAMRARDVSRPHAEHLAEAAEREEAATRRPEVPPTVLPPTAAAPAPAPQPAEPGPAEPAQAPSRRRRRRGR